MQSTTFFTAHANLSETHAFSLDFGQQNDENRFNSPENLIWPSRFQSPKTSKRKLISEEAIAKKSKKMRLNLRQIPRRKSLRRKRPPSPLDSEHEQPVKKTRTSKKSLPKILKVVAPTRRARKIKNIDVNIGISAKTVKPNTRKRKNLPTQATVNKFRKSGRFLSRHARTEMTRSQLHN